MHDGVIDRVPRGRGRKMVVVQEVEKSKWERGRRKEVGPRQVWTLASQVWTLASGKWQVARGTWHVASVRAESVSPACVSCIIRIGEDIGLDIDTG